MMHFSFPKARFFPGPFAQAHTTARLGTMTLTGIAALDRLI
jgi:hypothetical protein